MIWLIFSLFLLFSFVESSSFKYDSIDFELVEKFRAELGLVGNKLEKQLTADQYRRLTELVPAVLTDPNPPSKGTAGAGGGGEDCALNSAGCMPAKCLNPVVEHSGDEMNTPSLEEMLVAIHKGGHAERKFIVNIGAGLAGEDPVANSKELSSWAGISLDGKEAQFVPPKFTKIVALIDPGNAAELMDRGKAPQDIGLLKIDIDGCDCEIVEALIGGAQPRLRPYLIHIEVNPNFPPPISVMERFDPARRWGKPQVYYGCSLQAQVDLFGRFGFSLFQYEWPDHPDTAGSDAVYIHNSLLPSFPGQSLDPRKWWAYGNPSFKMYPPYVPPTGKPAGPFWVNYPTFSPAMAREWFEVAEEQHGSTAIFWNMMRNLTAYQEAGRQLNRFSIQNKETKKTQWKKPAELEEEVEDVPPPPDDLSDSGDEDLVPKKAEVVVATEEKKEKEQKAEPVKPKPAPSGGGSGGPMGGGGRGRGMGPGPGRGRGRGGGGPPMGRGGGGGGGGGPMSPGARKIDELEKRVASLAAQQEAINYKLQKIASKVGA